VVSGEPDLLVTKTVNSAFLGTPDLNAWLREQDIDEVVVCGITTNQCCETTARMAGNLGFRTLFALDATHAFDRRALDGGVIQADEIRRVSAANLEGEFATVVSTATLVDGA
jgi:nicotinamidase-related amidase